MYYCTENNDFIVKLVDILYFYVMYIIQSIQILYSIENLETWLMVNYYVCDSLPHLNHHPSFVNNKCAICVRNGKIV